MLALDESTQRARRVCNCSAVVAWLTHELARGSAALSSVFSSIENESRKALFVERDEALTDREKEESEMVDCQRVRHGIAEGETAQDDKLSHVAATIIIVDRERDDPRPRQVQKRRGKEKQRQRVDDEDDEVSRARHESQGGSAASHDDCGVASIWLIVCSSLR